MTNGDRIRSMTDQELAGIIMCPYGSDGLNCIDNERGLSCIDCSLEWIKAEYVDEESERLYE